MMQILGFLEPSSIGNDHQARGDHITWVAPPQPPWRFRPGNSCVRCRPGAVSRVAGLPAPPDISRPYPTPPNTQAHCDNKKVSRHGHVCRVEGPWTSQRKVKPCLRS